MKDKEKERRMIKDAAIKAAQRIVQPRAAKIDDTGEFPWDMVDAFSKQGFLSILLPEEYGGTNGDLTSFCLVVEEIAKVCGSSSLLILAQGVGTLPLLIGGNSSQQERCFTRISEEKGLTAFTLAEKELGLEATSIKTRVKKEGADYLLNGCKCFVINGSIADFYIVFAMAHSEKKEEGISAFLVEKGARGLVFGKNEKRIGMRGVMATDVIFENCRLPQENLLREEGKGWEIARKTIETSRPAMGAQAVGIAQRSLDVAVHYAKERVQFGKPIASFQAIQFMIADMVTQVETARALVYKAAALIDEREEDRKNLSAISKIFASDMAMKVTTDALQILGGYGYMKDYQVERMMRDAKVTQIYGEANQIQRLMVGQQLFR